METRYSGQSHSFDIKMATQYGIESALLIHHFQHWIRFNKKLKKNLKNEKTWTYQTKREIQAHFPYMSHDTIKYQLDKLIDHGVLISGNFNRSKFDKTSWYAFADPKSFGLDDDFSNNVYESGYPPSMAVIRHGEEVNRQPIPHTINTHTKKKSVSQPAVALTTLFFETLKQINPKIREPNFDSWSAEIDRMLKIDGRTEVELNQVIRFILYQHENPQRDFTWSKAISSPKKLRQHFASVWLEMNTKTKEQKVEEVLSEGITTAKRNKTWASQFYEKIANRLPTHIRFDVRDEYVMFSDKRVNSSIPFSYQDPGFQSVIEHYYRKLQ